MKLSLKTSGGWGAAFRLGRPPIQIETARLAPDEAAHIEQLVQEAFAAPSPPGAAKSGADAQSYVITCEDGAHTRQLHGSDLDPHPALEALKTFIERHAG